MVKRRSFLVASGALAALGRNGLAQAQAGSGPLSSGPLRIVVGFAPGGSLDLAARPIAEAVRETSGRNTIVDNRPGANGLIAVQAVVDGPTDGSLIVLCPSSTVALMPHVEPKLRFDAQRDLAPLSLACEFYFGVAVAAQSPIKTLAEYLAFCKANPDKANFGTPGTGSGPHFLGELLAREAGAKIVHAPYRGGMPAMQDVMGGALLSVWTTVPTLINLHRAGKIRILALTAPQRMASINEVPTFSELGFKALEFSEWFGFFAHSKTPPATIAGLNRTIVNALQAESARAAFKRIEFLPLSSTPDELAGRVREDLVSWGSLVKGSGFQIR
jgi:tripartite-type tricarboxylate transporter receptor subunit TctC